MFFNAFQDKAKIIVKLTYQQSQLFTEESSSVARGCGALDGSALLIFVLVKFSKTRKFKNFEDLITLVCTDLQHQN